MTEKNCKICLWKADSRSLVNRQIHVLQLNIWTSKAIDDCLHCFKINDRTAFKDFMFICLFTSGYHRSRVTVTSWANGLQRLGTSKELRYGKRENHCSSARRIRRQWEDWSYIPFSGKKKSGGCSFEYNRMEWSWDILTIYWVVKN